MLRESVQTVLPTFALTGRPTSDRAPIGDDILSDTPVRVPRQPVRYDPNCGTGGSLK